MMASASRRRFLWTIPLWLALMLILGGIGWRAIAGCGIAWVDGQPIFDYCPEPPEPDPRLALLDAERERESELEDALHRLRLTLIDAPDCPLPPEPPIEVAELPEPEPEPPEPEPEPEPPPPEPEPEVEPPPPTRVPQRRPDPPPLPPQPDPPPPEPEPQPAPQPPSQPPPPPPGPVHRCDTDMSAAGRHDDRRIINLGGRRGLVVLEYNTVRVPDRIEVWYHGLLLASTPGMVSGRGRLQFNFNPILNDPYVEVIVISNRMFPTRWGYRVNCPR